VRRPRLRRGPIISDAFLTPETSVGNGTGCGFARGSLLSLRWTAQLPSGEIDASLGLNRARGWSDVVEAARTHIAPAQNVSYADVDGNFGYIAAGASRSAAGRTSSRPTARRARASGRASCRSRRTRTSSTRARATS